MVMGANGSGVRQVLQAKPHAEGEACKPCLGFPNLLGNHVDAEPRVAEDSL
jgi:hypothetical protein